MNRGLDEIKVCYDVNRRRCLQRGRRRARRVVLRAQDLGPVLSLTLEPLYAVNATGTSHTVTATLIDQGRGRGRRPACFYLGATSVNSVTPESKLTDANGKATFTYTGVNRGLDEIKVCYDVNRDGVCNEAAGEPGALFSALKIRVPVLSLTLEPLYAVNATGTSLTVTATLIDQGGAVADAPLVFYLGATSVNSVTPESKLTDANGKATFTYTGVNRGLDEIKVCYDVNRDGVCNEVAGEPGALFSALKIWVPGPSRSTRGQQGDRPESRFGRYELHLLGWRWPNPGQLQPEERRIAHVRRRRPTGWL